MKRTVADAGEQPPSFGPATGRPIRVLLVDDRQFARIGLRAMLSGHPDIEVVGEAADPDEAIQTGRRVLPTVAVVNGQIDAAEVTGGLLEHVEPAPAVLILLAGDTDGDPARRAVKAGAAAVLRERVSHDTLLSALRLVAAGYLLLELGPLDVLWPDSGPWWMYASQRRLRQVLTRRELDVFRLLILGCSNAEVSHKLCLTENTVKSHVRSLLVKLGLRNRVELVVRAYSSTGRPRQEGGEPPRRPSRPWLADPLGHHRIIAA